MAFLRFSIVSKLFWSKRGSLVLKLLCFTLPVIVFCEFLIYYIVIIKCHWPQVKTQTPEGSEQTSESVLKAMFLADTHLLGEIQGHWLDKLRREWQMERAFQTALWLLQPEVVFILGDIFDEGKWSSSQAWSDDVQRFQKIFRHPAHTELIVIVGNHDIGFHYEMTEFKLKRFSQVFNFTSEKLVTRKGINFVLVNSIAMEGDGCKICRMAEAKLSELSHRLNCSLLEPSQYQKKCSNVDKLPLSSPILLQHYPLYRSSDAQCTGEDAAPLDKRNDPFTEKYDVLSMEAAQKEEMYKRSLTNGTLVSCHYSDPIDEYNFNRVLCKIIQESPIISSFMQLLWWFQPRLILSGHTHSACEVLHNGKIPEISVPSFSWRNRNNPSFIMGSITSTDFSLYKCFLPFENTVVAIYCAAGTVLALLILVHFQYLHVFSSPFVQHLITKHKAV